LKGSSSIQDHRSINKAEWKFLRLRIEVGIVSATFHSLAFLLHVMGQELRFSRVERTLGKQIFIPIFCVSGIQEGDGIGSGVR
jgi:hypothetical protein